jgi:hypothetical protein
VATNEITYKYVKGQGWLAGYWEEKEPPRFWATLDFAAAEQSIYDQLFRELNDPLTSRWWIEAAAGIPLRASDCNGNEWDVEVRSTTSNDTVNAMEYVLTARR